MKTFVKDAYVCFIVNPDNELKKMWIEAGKESGKK
jgi:hypothetical protein